MDWGLTVAIAGAASAAIFSGIGSAIGINYAAQVADGVLSEDPEKFGSLLVMVVLPGTQGIYGFVSAFLTILKLGLLGGTPPDISLAQGWQIFFACMPVALAGLVSAIYQGKVAAAGVAMTAKQPSHFMKGVIYAALVETYAILGLLVTILLINGIQL